MKIEHKPLLFYILQGTQGPKGATGPRGANGQPVCLLCFIEQDPEFNSMVDTLI